MWHGAASDCGLLEKAELFRGVPSGALAEIQASSFRRHLSTDEALVRQGDPAETLHIVLSGRLRVTQTTSEGHQIIIRYLGPEETVGYTTLSGGTHHPGTVTAVDDGKLLGWSAAAIRQVMVTYPQVAMNAVAILGARYVEMQTRLRERATQNVERRIAHTVLRLTRQAGRRTTRGIEIAFPLSRQDLAEMAGTTLHTVSRTLSGWESRGIVDSGRRLVVVCRPDALSSIANTPS
jgi:CRP-like cAMP-binding protein